jgi:hypothetical protein
VKKEHFSEAEWTVEEWKDAWTIKVGRAYACSECGAMAMVTKGGIGMLEPICCGREMRPVEKPEEIK